MAGLEGYKAHWKLIFIPQVSDHFDVKFENMFDLNFISYSKVKGAGVAFNFGFSKRVLIGKFARGGEIKGV